MESTSSSRMQQDKQPDYSDFTETHYKKILDAAKRRFAFGFFDNIPNKPHVLWRHDLDVSVHRALKLAEIEANQEVVATYFVRLHSEFYNLFERSIHDRVKNIALLGHQIGLHFEGEFYGKFADTASVEEKLIYEKLILENELEVKISAFSFHNPVGAGLLKFDSDRMGGMVNVYGRTIKNCYTYCSDSNGYWRHDRLWSLVSEGRHDRLHVLTHPEWWQERPMTPKERICRAVESRSQHQIESYLALLQSAGRRDVG